MSQNMERKSDPEEQGAIARLGAKLADWSEKWFPDAYVFAGIAVFIVCAAALAMGRSPTQVSVVFGQEGQTQLRGIINHIPSPRVGF